MPTKLVKSLITCLLLVIATLVTFPSEASHSYPTPSRKAVKREARMLKRKGKYIRQQGNNLVQQGRTLKDETGKRREARKLRREGRLLRKNGRNLEKQGRLLRKGKISSHYANSVYYPGYYGR